MASTTIKINYLTKGVLADGWVFTEEIGSDGFALVYKMTKEAEFPQKNNGLKNILSEKGKNGHANTCAPEI